MVHLSIVIPAFNEAARLPAYLRDVFAYLGGRPFAHEVIVVDDGSRDRLADVLRAWNPRHSELRVLVLSRNLGKGAAVRAGVAAVRGELVLFADADGATPIAEEEKLRAAIEQRADVAIGSRRTGFGAADSGSTGPTNRTFSRRTGAAVFSLAVRSVLGLPYHDTQCGFKMFRAAAAKSLFAMESRYLFDVEVLWWAERLGYRVEEIPVAWSERTGGHVRLVRDGTAMLWGLLRLRRRLKRRWTRQRQAG